MSKNKYYACLIEEKGSIFESWPECSDAVKGKKARYKGFPTRRAAREWLDRGAPYERRKKKSSQDRSDLPEDAVYFDAGTGRGVGVEINVTDRDGVPYLHLVLSEDKLTERGTCVLSEGRTNNYGELMACLMAMKIAFRLSQKKVYGDSSLVLNYWSIGRAKTKTLDGDPDLKKLVYMTAEERQQFERDGGRLYYVEGGHNPADLGYHRE